MNDRTRHPTADSLEAYVEGGLHPGDRAVIESHLIGCPRCENLVEDWRSLFQTLATLPRFAPNPGFADRVMARVRIPEAWYVRAGAAVTRFLPRSTRGWALAAAFLALPVLAGGSFIVWLLSKSYVTTHGLWVFVTDRFAAAIQAVFTRTLTFLMQTDVAAWTARTAGSLIDAGGARGIGAFAGGIAVMILICVWVLYSNLFRTPERDSNHAMFSF